MSREHTTVSQNRAHRSDIAWHKMPVSDTSEFVSEYRNVFTGQVIRKSCRMTGRDWFVFNAAGVVSKHHSLTFAKLAAAETA